MTTTNQTPRIDDPGPSGLETGIRSPLNRMAPDAGFLLDPLAPVIARIRADQKQDELALLRVSDDGCPHDGEALPITEERNRIIDSTLTRQRHQTNQPQ